MREIMSKIAILTDSSCDIPQEMAEKYGIDISDEALMKAIELHNEVSAVINEIGDYRKLDNPTITGYEFHVIQLCSQVCPKDLILPMLKETAKELKTRKPDKKSPFRCKVVLAGSENDDPEFTKLIEGCGAEVVCDRYCYGAVESRMPIEVKDGEKKIQNLTDKYCASVDQLVSEKEKEIMSI